MCHILFNIESRLGLRGGTCHESVVCRKLLMENDNVMIIHCMNEFQVLLSLVFIFIFICGIKSADLGSGSIVIDQGVES